MSKRKKIRSASTQEVLAGTAKESAGSMARGDSPSAHNRRHLAVIAGVALVGIVLVSLAALLKKPTDNDVLFNPMAREPATASASPPEADASQSVAPEPVGDPDFDITTLFAPVTPGAGGDAATSDTRQIQALKDEGLAVAGQIVQNFPQQAEAWDVLAAAYRIQGQGDQAAKAWQKAVQLNPDFFYGYEGLGWLAMEQSDYDGAIKAWSRLMEIQPAFPGLYDNLAKAYMGRGELDRPIEFLKRQLEQTPESPWTHFLLAQQLVQKEEWDEAMTHYLKTVEFDPNHANAHYGLFRMYGRQGESEKASQHMARFRELKKEELALRTNINDDYDDLAASADKISGVHIKAARVYRVLGWLKPAEALSLRAMELNDEPLTSLLELSAIYRETNQDRKAVDAYIQLNQIQPDEPSYLINMAIHFINLNRPQQAEQALLQAQKVAPEAPDAYRELARLYLRSNFRYEEARALARKTLEREISAENYFILSWAEDRSGNKEGAIRALEEAISLEPNNPKYVDMLTKLQGR